jgi:hypothetical protein
LEDGGRGTGEVEDGRRLVGVEWLRKIEKERGKRMDIIDISPLLPSRKVVLPNIFPTRQDGVKKNVYSVKKKTTTTLFQPQRQP